MAYYREEVPGGEARINKFGAGYDHREVPAEFEKCIADVERIAS